MLLRLLNAICGPVGEQPLTKEIHGKSVSVNIPKCSDDYRRHTRCFQDKITVCVNATWRSEGVIGLLMALQGVKDLSILDGACFTCRIVSKHDTDECERLEKLQEL